MRPVLPTVVREEYMLVILFPLALVYVPINSSGNKGEYEDGVMVNR